MLIIAIFLILIASYFLLNIKKKSSNKCAFDVFPAPSSDLLFGNIFQLLSTTDIIPVVSEFFKHGKTVTLRLGPSICPLRKILLTQDYKLIEFILSNNKILSKSDNYLFWSAWLGKGLLLSDGDHWRQHRKILTPAFHFEILKGFVEIFEKVGSVLIDKLKQYEGADSVDLDPLVTLCALDIICETAMGTKINAQSGETPQYVHSVKEICRISVERCVSLKKLFSYSCWWTVDFDIQRRILKVLHGFTQGVIDSKCRNRIEKKSKKMAFLDILLKISEEGNVLSKEEIREEVDTIMFAGHDTTSSGICFTLYCLAENPKVQEKVLREQKNLFGDEKNPDISYTDLQNMKYLEHVIKETFRLYSTVPVIGRYTTEEIEFDDCLIPKHTNIMIFIYNLHRNPEHFPEPEKFIPERFESFDSNLPFAYIPFSAGSRNCIGQKFAMLELKSVISKIVRHFEIGATSPRHELALSVEAVLKSTNGIRVALKERNALNSSLA